MKDEKAIMSGIIMIILFAVTGAYLLGTIITRDNAKGVQNQEKKTVTTARPHAGPDSPVAEVGGVSIPRWMFENAYRDRVRSEERRSGPLSTDAAGRIRSEIMDNLISMELLAQEAGRTGIVMSPGAGELRLRIVERSFKDKASFETALHDAGMDRERYRSVWQQQALVNRYVDEHIKPGVKVTEQDIRRLYEEEKTRFTSPEQIRASHILIKTEKDTDPAKARAAAEKLLLRLRQGEDFAGLARENSACPSAKDGGDLGWFERGKMDKAFEQAAFSLKPGELSAVVEGKAGFHIIRNDGFKPAQMPTYEELRPELERIVTEASVKAALDEHIAQLKNRVTIKIYQKG